MAWSRGIRSGLVPPFGAIFRRGMARGGRWPLALLAVVALVLALAACGDDDTPAADPEPTDPADSSDDADVDDPTEPEELSEVSVRLDWLFTGQQTAFFAARDNGHYEAAGLDVNIIEGSGSSDAAILTGTKEIDFGIVDSAVLASSRVEGIPIQAVAAIYQRSPINIFWLEDNVSINTPADLADGVRLGINEASAHAIGVEAFFAISDEIGRDDVDIVPVGFDVEPLIADQIDAMGGFSNVEPPVLEHEGHTVGQIEVADYGVELYGLTIVAHEDSIAERPEVVRAFVQATMAGFQDTIDDPDQATELLLAAHPEGEFELDKAIAEATSELVVSEDTEQHGLGWMDHDTWMFIVETLRELEVTPELVDVDGIYSTVAFE